MCSVWRKCPKWFVKFHAGDCSRMILHDQVGLIEVDRDQIETLIENNQHYTTGEIADILKMLKLSVKNYSHQLGYVHHFDVWFHVS